MYQSGRRRHKRTPVLAQYQWDSSRPREDEALQVLQNVASLVKPIMRKRGWKIGLLGEFWSKNCLGANYGRGRKIFLRLRRAGDEKKFLRMENIVDTMLHELCHIRYDRHDDDFTALWNKLRHEFNLLILNGYTGKSIDLRHKLEVDSNPTTEICMIGEKLERAAMEEMRNGTRIDADEEIVDEEAYI